MRNRREENPENATRAGNDMDAEAVGGVAPGGAEAEAAAGDLEDMRERWLRTAAELDNLRKRTARQIESETRRAQDRILEAFLPILDNLDRAVGAGEEADCNTWLEGMRAIRKQMLDVLAGLGVVPFECIGEPFDPNRHDAVAQFACEGVAAGQVVEEAQRGYARQDGSVLRHAKVVVAS